MVSKDARQARRELARYVDRSLGKTLWPASEQESDYQDSKEKYRRLVDHYKVAKQSLVKAYHLGLEPEGNQGLQAWKPVEVLMRCQLLKRR